MKAEAISVLDDCGGGRFAVCVCFRDIYVGAGQSQAAAPAVFKPRLAHYNYTLR